MGRTYAKTPKRDRPAATSEEASAPASARDKVGHLGYAEQVAALSPESVQFSGGEHTAASTDQVLSRAREGATGGGGDLPFGDRIQESFGHHDVSGIQAHSDGAAVQANKDLGSTAYASGDRVVFGSTPDLFTAAHEAAHVVQGRHGVQLQGGVGRSGDPYEQHADAVAHAVVSGGSAEGLLDQGVGAAHASSASAPPMTTVQFRTTDEASGPLAAPRAQRALRWCQGRDMSPEAWAQIAQVVGASSGELSVELVQKIAAFQSSRGLSVDGCPGDVTIQWLSQAPGGEGLDAYIQNDQVVYLGFNPGSRGPEYNTIRGVVGGGSVIGAMGERREDHVRVNGAMVDLTSDEGLESFVGSLKGLSDEQRTKLLDYLRDTVEEDAKDEMAQFARILYQAEVGQRVMKRVVFSGHSGGWSIWGDDNGGIDFEDLEELSAIFPNAVGQVEDLMLSACNTAQRSKLAQYTAIFPNLKSIWGYVGYSPSAATGSIKHIQGWARASTGPLDADKMNAAREDIAGQTGKRDQNVALWTREGDQESYKTASPYAKKDYPTMRSAVDSDMGHYQAAYQAGQIDLEALSALYTNLQNLVGNFRGALGQEADGYELAMKHVLYLRHWGNISRHFMRAHGALIQGAYADANVAMPDFAALSRDQTLAAIAAYPGDPDSEAFLLLRDTLKALNPEQIPDNWI